MSNKSVDISNLIWPEVVNKRQPQGVVKLSKKWLKKGLCHAIIDGYDYVSEKNLTLNGISKSINVVGRGLKAALDSSTGVSIDSQLVTSTGDGFGDFTICQYGAFDNSHPSTTGYAGMGWSISGTYEYDSATRIEVYGGFNGSETLVFSAGNFTLSLQGTLDSSVSVAGACDSIPKLYTSRRKSGSVQCAGGRVFSSSKTGSLTARSIYYSTATKINLQGYKSANWGNTSGVSNLFLAFNTALTDQEILDLNSNPWILFENPAEIIYPQFESAGSISGSLATTNANDTLASTGSPIIVATLAKTNANDTLSSSGTSTIVGSLATTNGNDPLASSGTTTIVGSLAKTNANDTLVSSGTTTVTGALARTNSDDVLVASGTVSDSIAGSLATTNANDTLVSAGSTTIVATLAKTNANDLLVASGSPVIVASLATTNSNDTLSASGNVPSVGTLAYTNNNDSIVASGTVTGAVNLTPQDLINIADAVWSHSSATHIELLLNEAWGRLGLDISAPLISGQTEISFGSIVMALNEASGVVTCARQ